MWLPLENPQIKWNFMMSSTKDMAQNALLFTSLQMSPQAGYKGRFPT